MSEYDLKYAINALVAGGNVLCIHSFSHSSVLKHSFPFLLWIHYYESQQFHFKCCRLNLHHSPSHEL